MIELVAVVGGLIALNAMFAGLVVLLRIKNTRRARRYSRIENRWNPAIIGAIAGDSDVYFDVPPSEADFVLETAGRFARRLRGPDRERVRELVAPLVPRLIPVLASRSPEKRAEIIELLSILAPDEYGAHIAAALDDPSERVSLVAARALAIPDHPEYASAILEHLPRYTLWTPVLLSSMLAQIGGGGIEEMRAFFADEERDTRSRGIVCGALRLLRDLESAPIAADAISSDDPELVIGALRLIRVVGSTAQVPQVRALLDHPEFFIRAEVATVLGRIGSDDDIVHVARLMGEDSPWVTIRAARSLSALGQRSMLRDLASGDSTGALSAREVLHEEAV